MFDGLRVCQRFSAVVALMHGHVRVMSL